MKFNNLILTASALASVSFAQVTSDVVGYETLEKQVGFNYLGLRFVESQTFSGTVATVSGATLTLSSETSVATDSHLLEITSGVAEGTVIEINNGSGSDINISQDLSSEIAAGDTVTIRPVQTLASIFGTNNDQNLVSTASYGGSDQVWVPNRTGDFEKYAYLQAGFFGQQEGWYSSNDDGVTIEAINPETVKLNYVDGIIVNSRNTAEIIVSGTVKTTLTSIAITNDFTYIGTNYPAGATLGSVLTDQNTSNLESASSFGASDQVLIPDGNGNLTRYAYLQQGFFGQNEGWYTSEDGINSTPVNASEIELTSGAIISRANSIDKNITLNAPDSYSDL